MELYQLINRLISIKLHSKVGKMNKYAEEIAKWLLNSQTDGKLSVNDFLISPHIEELTLKAYVFELFTAIDNIDTRLDSMKPDLSDSFVKAVCFEINKVRMDLASLGFDKRFLEEEQLCDKLQLSGNYLQGL